MTTYMYRSTTAFVGKEVAAAFEPAYGHRQFTSKHIGFPRPLLQPYLLAATSSLFIPTVFTNSSTCTLIVWNSSLHVCLHHVIFDCEYVCKHELYYIVHITMYITTYTYTYHDVLSSVYRKAQCCSFLSTTDMMVSIVISMHVSAIFNSLCRCVSRVDNRSP